MNLRERNTTRDALLIFLENTADGLMSRKVQLETRLVVLENARAAYSNMVSSFSPQRELVTGPIVITANILLPF